MPRAISPFANRSLRPFVAVVVLATFAGCRDRAADGAASTTDSTLARDLAMAQQQVPPQTVFNDAPLGGTMNASPAPAEPDPRPEPPRMRTPRPAPTPRRESPPAPVIRSPRPAPPAPVAEEPTPSPVPAPNPGPAPGIIGVGSQVGMTTNDRVCTRALAGDKFTATVSSATTGINGAVIPAGSTVVLEVASVDRADPIEMSRIRFRVRAIDVNGEPQSAEGDVATLGPMESVRGSSGNDRTKVVGGAVAGAVLGQIMGRSTKATVIGAAAGAAAGTAAAKRSKSGGDACLPDGSALRLTLSREIVVRREGQL